MSITTIMSIISFSLFSTNAHVFSWTLVIVLIIWHLASFYLRVARLPKGPFPLPIIGNLPYIVNGLFINKNRNPNYAFLELQEKYGPIYTVWLLNKPMVVVADLDLVKNSFSQNKFNGRQLETLLEIVTGGRGSAIIFQDIGPEWSSLRKVAHNAVRKFVNSDRLPIFVNDSVSKTVAHIKSKGGRPVDINAYIAMITINIIASIGFGKSYDYDDSEFVYIAKHFKMMAEDNDYLLYADSFPKFLKPIFLNLFGKKSRDGFGNLAKLCRSKLKEHLLNYQDGTIRDFADSLIAAKNEAINEGKESKDYLTNRNLGNAIFDLFFAGVDTSSHLLTWCFLFMSKYPEMQMKMRQEVSKTIGDQIPMQDDKENCHYLMAFVSEALRMRSMPTFGVVHKTVAESKIGNHEIPANSLIACHFFSIMNNKKYWSQPDTFDPYRFLGPDGRFTGQSPDRPAAFIPFGVGRRVCLGERLAWVNLFLILANIFRLTHGYVFEFNGKPEDVSLDLEPNLLFYCEPKPFRVKLVKQFDN